MNIKFEKIMIFKILFWFIDIPKEKNRLSEIQSNLLPVRLPAAQIRFDCAVQMKFRPGSFISIDPSRNGR